MQTLQYLIAVIGAKGPVNQSCVIQFNTNCVSLHLSASSAHHGSGGSERTSGPIRCQRCRDVCKGEVVRVQDTHFHVKCFTCAGKTCEHDPFKSSLGDLKLNLVGLILVCSM